MAIYKVDIGDKVKYSYGHLEPLSEGVVKTIPDSKGNYMIYDTIFNMEVELNLAKKEVVKIKN